MGIIDILNFALESLAICEPIIQIIVPLGVAFGFVASVPDLFRYFVGVRK